MIGGEDLADRNILSPVVGIWSPNVLLFIISAYLLLHTVREQPPLRINLNIFKRFKKKKMNPNQLVQRKISGEAIPKLRWHHLLMPMWMKNP